MGNNNTRESRQGSLSHEYAQPQSSQSQSQRDAGSSRSRGRTGRAELGSLLGINNPGSSNNGERRETRQEREARRLERERKARLVERERSMREEHVDGGYLVTLGTYVGSEDFNKQIVRQLQIERRLAPFWRGLNDFSDTWTEYQIAAAARGLEVPAADEPPPDDFFSRPGTALSSSPPRLNYGNTLTVPQGGSSTGASQPTDTISDAIPVGGLAGTSSPAAVPTSPTAVSGASTPRGSSSQFKPRAKALAAALSVGSRNSSSTDIAPREIQLPHDPFVNGQPIEVFLYKNAEECPICFLTYPPYLNHTRCCRQEICSECFVQIKRADPHYPEGHGDNGEHANPELHPEEQAGQLISEPACCPYCQQPEFGVTYDPPPFRRGLVYAAGSLGHGIGAMGAAMSSSSSVNSGPLSPTAGSPPAGAGSLSAGARRRAQSLSANAPNVITTDRVRPDWATKLASQRAHIARRAAAATALHTAAFLIGNQETRSFRVSRFGRRNTAANSSDSGSQRAVEATAGGSAGDGGGGVTIEPGPRTASVGQGTAAEGGSAAGSGGARRSNMDDLEELMFREALRQSLASEEERRRQEEKRERKEAKRQEKLEHKGDRKSLGGLMKRLGGGSGSTSSTNLYSGGSGGGGEGTQSAASASSLSLGAGNRRRGNSGASNLRVEASVVNAMAIGGQTAGAVGSAGIRPTPTSITAGGDGAIPTTPSATPAVEADGSGKGKGVDRGSDTAPAATATRPAPMPSQPSAGPSHLRQMSSASSVSSTTHANLQDPRGSAMSFDTASEDADRGDRGDHGDHGEHADDPSTSADALFNFGSLAEAVGVHIDGPHAGRRMSAVQPGDNEKEDVEHTEHAEHAEHAAPSTTTALDDIKQAPELLVTPGTPTQSEQ